MIQLYRVSDELSKYPANHFDIVDNDSVVIVHDTTVRNYIKTHYNSYYMTESLNMCFGVYMATTREDFITMYKAWTTEYEPLENYNRNETVTHIKNIGNEETTNTGDITANSATENDSDNTPTTKHYTTTYDSAVENRLENYDVSTGRTTSDTTTTQNTTTETEYKTTTLNNLTAHEVEINTNKTFGNIGVTTSQQMLQSEIDLRKQHLIQMYLDTFCKQYMFYVGGFDDVYSYILP